jgi:hypothetical protein
MHLAVRFEWLKANWHSLDGTLDPFVLLVAFTISIFSIGEHPRALACY